jgi:hypothetical protein
MPQKQNGEGMISVTLSATRERMRRGRRREEEERRAYWLSASPFQPLIRRWREENWRGNSGPKLRKSFGKVPLVEYATIWREI